MSQGVLLTVDAVNGLLRAVVMDVCNLPAEYVLVETRTRPRPYDDRLYATIYWYEQELLNQFTGDFTPPAGGEDGTERLKNTAHCIVRITLRGPDAYNVCSNLRYAIDSANRQWDLWAVLGFAGVTNITDLSAVYGAQVQQRSFFDLSFYAAFGREYPLSWFSRCPFIVNKIKNIYPREEEPCPKAR